MNRHGAVLRRFEDPEHSADPQLRAIVAELRTLEYAPAPRPEFRAELRAQLVAIAPRVVAEGQPAEASPASVPTSKAAELLGTKRRRVLGRPLGVAAACVAVLALGLGGAVWKSQSALPGDSLYGLKRASEDVRLSMTSGDADRGHEYLSLASTRVQEARDLLGHQSASASGSGILADGLSPQTAQLVRSTLTAADSDLFSGSSLLGSAAVSSHSVSPLTIMQTWAPQQVHQLDLLAGAVGTGPRHSAARSIHTSAVAARALVRQALGHATALAPQVKQGCSTVSSGRFGPSCAPVPAAPAGTPTTVDPSEHARKHPTTPGTKQPTSGGTVPTGGPTNGPTSSGGSQDPSGKSGSTPTPAVPILPTLPTVLPSASRSVPVSVGSCGVSAQIGPIGLKLGSCPPHS